ncbi:MAG TPA: hypothetical protein VGB65_09365 [Allosphingosinicella sp.]|jgi:hypothetical protein
MAGNSTALFGLIVIVAGCGQAGLVKSPDRQPGADVSNSALPQSPAKMAPQATPAARLVGPRFFSDKQQNEALLHGVREGLSAEITFAGHFSEAYVDCGTACGSHWFVDRRTGSVEAAPDESPDGMMVWSLETRRDSDLVKVIYGPQHGVGDTCAAQSFRWTGKMFERLTGLQPVACPH